MKKLRIYVDSSVIGGCFDPEFEKWSNGLFRDFHVGTFLPVISEIVDAEMDDAPEEVKHPAALVLHSLGDAGSRGASWRNPAKPGTPFLSVATCPQCYAPARNTACSAVGR